MSPNEHGFFDLVVDFSDPPLLSAEVPPYGYYPVVRSRNILQRALTEAPRLVGRFRKSRYFSFDPLLCAHSRKGVPGCSRCLPSCPADAISTVSAQVHVDAFLCKGCGTCTLVCPTGALSYAETQKKFSLQQLQEKVLRDRAADDELLHIVLYSSAMDAGKLEQWLQQAGSHVLPVSCKVLAATGMDSWLTLLAMGNISLTLLVDQYLPALSHAALQEEVASTRKLLQALGVDAEVLALRSVEETGTPELVYSRKRETGPPAVSKPEKSSKTKRMRVWQAINAMSAQTNDNGIEITLPKNASFGGITVSEECTLCNACSQLCPTQALQQSTDMQSLLFTEANCVQCDMCQQACPEKAITLIPRILLDAARRDRPQAVHTGNVAHCIECGEPIMSQALLDAGFKHVRHHPLFQGEGGKTFKLCARCRVQAAALDQVLSGTSIKSSESAWRQSDGQDKHSAGS